MLEISQTYSSFSYLLISKAHVISLVGAIYQSTSKELQLYFCFVKGAVQQAPVPLQKMQTSNGYSNCYAIPSCMSMQNVKVTKPGTFDDLCY